MNAHTGTHPSEGHAFVIDRVTLLTESGWQPNSRIEIVDGKIAAIGDQVQTDKTQWLDGRNGYLVPGIIDLHGDAFERHITPRTGTLFPLELALAANDASLVANGITTFFYSITDGFEPGPRSRETVRKLLLALERLQPKFACQAKVHIRHEKANIEGHEELVDWLQSGRIHLLSLNDHLPEMDNPVATERYLDGLRRRVSMTAEQTQEFLRSLQGRRAPGEEQVRELATIARESGVSLASHDDHGEDDVERNRRLGTAIAEFPMDAETALASRRHGASVLMGAPNLVRGGSHVGAISVRDAIEQNLVSILCSDYHYPSLLHAPFKIAELGLLPFEESWKMVSENPAIAAGYGQRKGRIAEGFDADFLLLDDLEGSPLSIRSTFVGGKPVFTRQNSTNPALDAALI